MRMLRTFLPLLALPLLAASPAAGAPSAQAAALRPYETLPSAATPPSLYSFADVYRLAVSAQAPEGARIAEPQAYLRPVSHSSAQVAPEPSFRVSAPRDGGRWPLLLAGLFACAWVAHRRLTSPY